MVTRRWPVPKPSGGRVLERLERGTASLRHEYMSGCCGSSLTYGGFGVSVQVIDTNLTGTFQCCREAYTASMAEHGGTIVNIVADMWRGFPGMVYVTPHITCARRLWMVSICCLPHCWAQAHGCCSSWCCEHHQDAGGGVGCQWGASQLCSTGTRAAAAAAAAARNL